MSATASQAFLWACDHNLPHLIHCISLFLCFPFQTLLDAINQSWTFLRWGIWQIYHSSVEAGHADPELDTCDQWLSIIILIPWPVSPLSAYTTSDIFHAMLPNPFLIVCDITVLVFPEVCSPLPHSLLLYPPRKWVERCCWLLPSHLPPALLLATPPAAWSSSCSPAGIAAVSAGDWGIRMQELVLVSVCR